MNQPSPVEQTTPQNLQYCAICKRVIHPGLLNGAGAVQHQSGLAHSACLSMAQRPTPPTVVPQARKRSSGSNTRHRAAGANTRGPAAAAPAPTPPRPAARDAKSSPRSAATPRATTATDTPKRKTTAAITSFAAPVGTPGYRYEPPAAADRRDANPPRRGWPVAVAATAVLILAVGGWVLFGAPAKPTATANAAGNNVTAAPATSPPAAAADADKKSAATSAPASNTPTAAPKKTGDGYEPAGPAQSWLTDEGYEGWQVIQGDPARITVQIGELTIAGDTTKPAAAARPDAKPFQPGAVILEHPLPGADYELTFEARLHRDNANQVVGLQCWTTDGAVIALTTTDFHSYGWTPVKIRVAGNLTHAWHGSLGHATLTPAAVNATPAIPTGDRATMIGGRPVLLLYATADGGKYIRNVNFTPLQPIAKKAPKTATAANPVAATATDAAPPNKPNKATFNNPNVIAAAPAAAELATAPAPGSTASTAAAEPPTPGPAAPVDDTATPPAPAAPAQARPSAAAIAADAAAGAPQPPAAPAPQPGAKDDGALLINLDGKDMKNGIGVWKRMKGAQEAGQVFLQWTCVKLNSFPFFEFTALKQLPQQVNVHVRYRIRNFPGKAIAIRVYYTDPETGNSSDAECTIPTNGEGVWLEGDGIMRNIKAPINQVEVRPADGVKEGTVIEIGQILISDGPVKAPGETKAIQQTQQAQQAPPVGAAPAIPPPAAAPAAPAPAPAPAPQPAAAQPQQPAAPGAAPAPEPALDKKARAKAAASTTTTTNTPAAPDTGGVIQTPQLEQAGQTEQGLDSGAKRKRR